MKNIYHREIHTSCLLRSGLPRIILALLFSALIAGPECSAQNINKIEYFFDTDPGIGNGTDLTFTPAPDLTNLNFTIPVASLSGGFHQLFVRSRDENMKWSLTSARPFYKSAIPGTLPDVAKVEYFFDTDPGTGNGTNVPVTPGTNLNNLVVNVPVGGLPNGFHTLYFRSRDAYGKWSLTTGHSFYAATAPATLPNITKVEYFIDTDPGYGQATNVPISPSTNLSNLVFPVDLLCLSAGDHHIYVRALDSFGKWSLVSRGTMTRGETLVNVTGPTTFCGGQSVQLGVSSAPGRTFQWHRNNVPVSGATGAQYQATESGDFYVRITAQGGCTDTSNTVTVNVTPSFPVSVSIAALVNPVYPGSAATFTATPVNGGTAPVFQWKVNGVNAGMNSPTYSYTPANDDTVTCMLTSNVVCPTGNPATSNAIIATGIPNIAVTPASLNYGVVYIGQTAIRTVTISNTGNAYLHITSIASGNPEFTASIQAITISPSQSYNLTVTYHPVTSGNISSALTLASNDPDQGQLTIPLSGQGLAAPVISVLPASLNATLEPNQVAMLQLKIRNIGGSPLTFNISETAAWLSAWPLNGSLAPGDSIMTGVSFSSGQSAGTFSANLKIISNDPVTSLIYIPVSLAVIEPLWVSATADPVNVCTGSSAQLNAIPHGGYPGNTYAWSSDPPGFTSTLQNPVVYPVVTTTYTATVSDGHSSANSQVTVTVFPNQAPAAVSNMLPANNAGGVQLPLLLSWSPSVNAATYDLYVWNSNDPQPPNPYAANLSQINFLFYGGSGMSYSDTCKWRVVAKNPCSQAPGPVQTFSIKGLPNLHVTSVTNSQPMAGQPVTISWTVKNDGNAETPTGATWLDRVWITPDLDVRIGETEDILLGQFQNVGYLAAGESYTQTRQIMMPENLIGNYHLFVITDDLDAVAIYFPPSGPPLPYNPPPFLTAMLSHGGSTVAESVEHDNFFYKEMLFPVPPLPDLQVKSVIGPSNIFSGQQGNVTWTVKNEGDGNTGATAWRDKIYFSPDTLFSLSTATLIGGYDRTGMLNPDSSYSASKSVTIPPGIFGKFYFFVKADADSVVFEYLNEGNNLAMSDSVTVFLTPPPDFVVTGITAPDTLSNNDLFNISWTVENQGATAPQLSIWEDAVYISASPVFDPAGAMFLGKLSKEGTLEPDSSYSLSSMISMVKNISGPYYFYVKADAGNIIFEYNNESNNIRRSDTSVFIITPDLTVSEMTIPAQNSNSQSMNIRWTIRNNGPGKIFHQSWRDKIMASGSAVYNPDSVVTPGWMDYTDITMPAGGSISRNLTISLPDSLSGPCYIYIQTDWQNKVYENGLEANNLVRSPEPVVMLKPDLAVSDITTPSIDSTGQPLNITWKVTNTGQGAVYNRKQTDRIMISYSPVYNPETVIPVDTLRYTMTLQPGAAITKQKPVNIPDSIPGPFYIFIRTDSRDEIYENLSEANNIGRSPLAIQRIRPDLIVEDLVIPVSATWGDSIMVRWTTKNNGDVAIVDKSWTDRVTISNQPIYHASSEEILGNLPLFETLRPGDTLQNQLAVTLPDGIQGTWYIHVVADAGNNIREGVMENNNVSGAAIQINTGPWADLQVMEILVTDTSVAGTTLPLNYMVKNSGTRALHNKTWSDGFFLSNLPVWNPVAATYLGQSYVSIELQPDSAYTTSTSVTLPSTLQTGSYYLYVFTDADSAIFENSGENNNVLRSDPVFINALPPVDLVVSNVISPASANSHDSFTVQWTVTNTANPQTILSWEDAIYLSADSVLSTESDIFLGKRLHYGALPMDSNYSGSLAVVLPNGISGDYYLLAVADYRQSNHDDNLQNNARSRTNAACVMQPIHITLTPPPDLLVTSFSVPTQAFTGKPFKVKWSVANNGTGVTVPSSWVDRIYLSTDFTINNGDLHLVTRPRAEALNVNQTYTDSAEIILPNNLSGNYILLAVTDYSDAVYEMNENNNTKSAFIVVSQPPPADLVVSTITSPATVVAGEPATIQWSLKNMGQNPANGLVKDIVYLSPDTAWDIRDVLFGYTQTQVNLAAGDSIARSLTARVNDLPMGTYYPLVRTDALNSVYESNENNNLSASSAPFFADVRVLPLGVLTPDTLNDYENLYFRIPVGDSLQEETMLATLKADSVTGMNEMYLEHQGMPTRITYDYSDGNPYHGNQEIMVPSLLDSNYYMLLYGNTHTGNRQNINIKAEILPFMIRSVDPATGGNTGKVTIRITGSKFDPLMQVKLVRDSITIVADTLRFIDYSKVFATFDLRDIQPGIFDLVITKQDGETVLRENGFEVVPGIFADLLLNVIAPPTARPNRVTGFTIEYVNPGNTDIVNPEISIESLTLSPIALSIEQLSSLQLQLSVPVTEETGTGGILRPGGHGYIIVYSRSVSGLGFLVK